MILPIVLIASGVAAYLLAKKKRAPVPAAAAKVVGHVQGEVYVGPDPSMKGYTWNAATSHWDPPAAVPHPTTPVVVPKPTTPASAMAVPNPAVPAFDPSLVPSAKFDTGPGTVTVGPIQTLEGITGIAVPTVDSVSDIQKALNRLGYIGANGKPLVVDGNMGAALSAQDCQRALAGTLSSASHLTRQAVCKFQNDHGLKVDSEPGPLTKSALVVAVTGLGTADK